MAVTQNTYTGDGSTVLFSFTFPYLATTDIKVSVDGTETTAYSLANATTIQFSTAPANGSAVRIFRDTNVDTLSAEFFSGSAIRANDLNSDFNQVLYSTQETVNRRVESTGGDMTGDLTMVNADIVFEGSTNDSNETTLTVVDPTADRTITLPNVSGTVVTTGDSGTVSTGMVADSAITSAKIANGTIVDADVANNAELSVSKLQDGSPRQLLQTNTAGTGVEWTSNVDVPGSLDVTGAATLDNGLSVTGNIGVSGTVDGRDVAADGTKLDGIESGATADQTAAEIRTLVESASDSNVFTDADHSKLNAIEAGATADQTASEIRTLVGNATNSNVYIDSHHAILDGATVNTSELNTLDGITASTAELNQLDGKSISSTLTPSNANDIPTSSAVNTFVSGLLNALGGFVAITNENSFPTSNPDPSDDAGTIVSIADAGGMVINSSGVGTGQTTAGTAVTINGFPGSLQNTTLGVGLGLQVQTTSTLNTYTYHKLIAKEADVKQLSDDINDFQARYRVSDTAPTTDLDEGDLWYDKTANKMKVYDTSTSAWKEVQSVGNFFINTLSSSSATGGGSATFNGSAYRFTLSNAPESAQQLLVSVNGVIQKPNAGTSQPSEGFALDTNDIIFAAAPATGSDFFIITVGSTVNIGAPSNNTVNAAHIIDGSITNAEISGSAAIASSKLAKPIDFADNEKARFGTGNDLEIQHNGIDSYVTQLGTGDLYLQNLTDDKDIVIQSDNGSGGVSEYIRADGSSGNVRLYYYGTQKFQTESGGIDVTGTVKSDGLDVDGTSDLGGNVTVSSGNLSMHSGGRIFVGNGGNAVNPMFANVSDTNTGIAFPAADEMLFSTGGSERLKLDSSGNVGLGVSTPTERLHLLGNQFFQSSASTNTTQNTITFRNTIASGYTNAQIEVATDSQYWTGNLLFRTASASNANILVERMRINSSGNVGIAVSNPSYKLHVVNDGSAAARIGGTNNYLELGEYASNSSPAISYNGSGASLPIRNGTSEVARFDPSSQFLIGETSAGGTCKIGMSFGNSTGNYMEIGGTNRHANGHSKVFVFRHGYWGGSQEVASIAVATGSSTGGSGSGSGNIVFNTGTSGNGDSGSTVTEKMRVGSNGSIRMVCQSDSALAVRNTAGAGNSVSNFVGIYGATDNFNGTASIRIYTSGNVYNSNNTYGSLSDIKLKENIVDSGSQWNDIKDIRIRKYNFKESTNYETHTQLGVIAQEVETVSPGLVTEVPDTDGEGNDLGTTTKVVNYAVLYMKAVKTLQEAMDRIETLETQNASLEARLTALEGAS